MFQGLKPLSDARNELLLNSKLGIQAVTPAIGLQIGMYGECLFDPTSLLLAAPTPEELESRFINVGDQNGNLQANKLTKNLHPMLNQSDINAEFEVNPRGLNRMLEFKRTSLNKRFDRVINTTLAEQQAALTRGKIT